jgi:5-methyltetrahydropteroyltriglutamate--homocysteine methyltransferase
VKRSIDRILTTHPGRLPDPANRDAVMQARDRDDRAAFDAGVKAGVAEMIAKQREVGIDIISDGEFWKARDQIYYGSRATGIEARH